MNYEQALEYIHGINAHGSKLGLSRTRELLNRMGNPQDSLRFVHIAGTNGKGSTAAMISHVMVAAGYVTGLYISPFINRFNERIQLNNVPIADDELAELTEYVKGISDSMDDPPTEFETITAIAMEYYRRKDCQIVVLEVGLGGELDSTNVIKTPEVAVITAISFDHTRVLGNTLAEIASAKAGIIKEGGDVVIYGQEPDAESVFNQVCQKRHARMYKTDFSKLKTLEAALDGQEFCFGRFHRLFLPLIGSYQPKNAAVAITALEVLKNKGFAITDDSIVTGLSNTRWPGRFEVLSKSPVFIVDGGHNPHGVRGTTDSIRRYFPDKKVVFVLGVMADKDISDMLYNIAPLASKIFTVAPDNPRSMPAGELASLVKNAGIESHACGSVKDGVAMAIASAGKEGIVCAIGSLYMAGEVRSCFNSIK